MSTSALLTDYDMVLAVTQDTLNHVLKTLPASWLSLNYQLSENGPGLYSATMSSPTVSVRLPDGTTDPHKVVLTLTFTGGTLKWMSLTGEYESADMTGVALAFTITLSSAPTTPAILEQQNDPPPQVQAAITNATLSVAHLYLDFINAGYQDAVATLNGQTITDMYEWATLVQVLEDYYTQMQQQEQIYWIVSYLIAAQNGGEQEQAVEEGTEVATAAIFAPTSYSYSTTPYIYPAGSSDEEYDALSTINYLMMTGGASAPTATPTMQPGVFGSNWVPGPNSDNVQGVLTIANALFIAGYIEGMLLPALAGALGVSESFTSVSSNIWSLTDTQQPYATENGGKGEIIAQKGIGNTALYGNPVSTTECQVALLYGSAVQLQVSGSYSTRMNYYLDLLLMNPQYYATVTSNWIFTLTLVTGGDGTIAVQVSSSTPTTTTDQGGDNLSGDLEVLMNDVIGEFTTSTIQGFDNDYASLQSSNYSALATALGKALDDVSNVIVLPGYEDFFYKDLLLNSEQDIQATIAYKT